MRTRILQVLTLSLLLFVAEAVSSQTVSSTLSGSVVDRQDAAIVNAHITATNLSKNRVLTAQSDSQGRFVFAQIDPGIYKIEVESPGFRKVEKTGIELNANTNLPLGVFRLEPGQVTESVEVQAVGVQLQTESAERSDTLISKQVTNIALNSRSYLPLLALVPGVTTTPNLQTASHAGLGGISVNGLRANQNNLSLDGINNVDTGNNGDQLATISLDSVQEFRVLSSNYQAQYGRSGSSQIVVLTKSGTPEYHGSGYLFHRHESLNANNWINKRDGLPRKKQRYNDAGYTFGGPVAIPGFWTSLKDKMFFFFSQEYQRQLNPQTTKRLMVPTALERQGDFSQSVDKNGKPYSFIRDSTTGQPCSASNTSGCFKAGGVLGRIPQDRLYAPGLAILNLLPAPNALGNVGFNYQSQISDSYPRREDLFRVDYNLSDKWKVFGRFLNNSDHVDSYYGSFVLNSIIPVTPVEDKRPGSGLAFGVTTILNNTTTNEATVGYGKNKITIVPTTDAFSRAKNGLTNLPQLFPTSVQLDVVPQVIFDAGTRIALGSATTSFSNSRNFSGSNGAFRNGNATIQANDNFSKVLGQHTAKFGFYFERSRKDQTNFGPIDGSFDFSDDSSNPFDTSFGFANAALGIYRTFTQSSAYVNGRYRYTNVEWYGQDTWKLTRRLTLDYGMRFYWIQPQYDQSLQTSNFLTSAFDPTKAPRLYQPAIINGQRSAFDPVTGQTLLPFAIGRIVPGSGSLTDGILPAGKGINKYLMKDRGIHYGPRVGFAYDITGHSDFVLRGGGGLFYDRYQGNIIFDEITNPPTIFQPSLTFGFINQIDANNALLGPPSLNAVQFEGKIPTVSSFSLGVQSKLPYSFVLDTAYVGSRSSHLLQRLNLNAVPYGATFLPQNQDPTKQTTSSTLPGQNALPADFLRPYPGFSTINETLENGSSNYNSLQVTLNRRFARGLFLGASYTWGKALGATSDDRGFIRIDNLNRLASYGPLNIDRRHTLVLNYIYEIPNAFSTGSWLHTVLDGWQIAGLTTFQTGTPYEVTFQVNGYSNQNITGSYTEAPRVLIVGSPKAGTSDDPYHRLNPAAFAPPPVGSIGLGEGRNPFTGPGVNNSDLSLQKSFAFHERAALQLRLDAFNALNHTQFGGSGTVGINNNIVFTNLSGTVANAADPVTNKTGFGSISSARDPRILQLAARIVF